MVTEQLTKDIWQDWSPATRYLCQRYLVDKADKSKLTRFDREVIACITAIRMDCEHFANMHGTVINLLAVKGLSKLYGQLIHFANLFEVSDNDTFQTRLGLQMALIMDVMEGSTDPVVVRTRLTEAGYSKDDISDIVGIVAMTMGMCAYINGLGLGNTSLLPIADTDSVFEQYIGVATSIIGTGYKVLDDHQILMIK